MNESDLIRLDAVVNAADAERATAEACAALGTGCMEEVRPDGTVRAEPLDHAGLRRSRPTFAPPLPPPASPRPRGGRAEDASWQDAMRRSTGRSSRRARAGAPAVGGAPAPPAGRGDRPRHGVRDRPARHHPRVPDAPRRAPRRRAAVDAVRLGVLSVAARRLGWDPVTRSTTTRSRWRPRRERRRNGVALTVGGAPSAPTACPRARRHGETDGHGAADVFVPRSRRRPAAPDRVRGCAGGGRPASCGVRAARAAVADRIDEDGWATVLLAV